MKLIKNILLILVVVGLVIFTQWQFFPRVEITTTTDTIYVQHTDTIVTVKPIPYTVVTPPDTIMIPADTSELIKRYKELHQDFYTKRYYSQDYKVDTIGTANIKGRVFMNRLDSLEFTYNLLPPTIINSTTVVVKNSGFYAGLFYDKGFVPTIAFNQKNTYIYSLGYNLNTKSISLGVMVNINSLIKKR